LGNKTEKTELNSNVYESTKALNDPIQPVNAIGFPNRDPDFDVLPGFQNPPRGYGEIPFYWWVGDKLEKERLLWQLDKLIEKNRYHRLHGVVQMNF
jgi:hypothetical protein